MQCSNSSPQSPKMNENHNRKWKLQYTENWHCGTQQSGWFDLVQFKYNTMPHNKTVCFWNCVDWPLKVCEPSWSARDVSNHISNTPMPALFLAYRAVTQLTLGNEGALFYLWCSPNSNKTSPLHAKMLNVAAHASWWQWSTCLWRSTKADFDIRDDKETHTLRSSNRHFKIVVSAQTWCSGLNHHLWSHI